MILSVKQANSKLKKETNSSDSEKVYKKWLYDF